MPLRNWNDRCLGPDLGLQADRRCGASHYGACGRASNLLREPRAPKGRGDAGVGKHVGHRIFLWLLRVTFEDRTAILSHVIDRCFQQLHGDAFAPIRRCDKKARDGPHRLVVDSLKQAGTIQSWIRLARRQGTPSHWLITDVRQQPRRLTGLNNPFERLFVGIAFLGFVFGALQAPQHTPTAATGSALAKEFLQIRPARQSEWTHFYHQGGWRLRRLACRHTLCHCKGDQKTTGHVQRKVARPPRLERGTLCLEGRCSIQLSYGRTVTNYAVFFGGRKSGFANEDGGRGRTDDPTVSG